MPHEWGAGDARAGGEPPQGVGVSAVPHPGRGSNPPHPPPPHSPPNACANRPPRGEGRAGEPPPRGAPWGAFATSRAASPLSRSRVARKELPARGLAATQSLRALCAGQAAWHPATATQRWLARKRSEKSPLKVSRPHDTQPLPTASALAWRGESVGVGGVGVGLGPFKGFFEGQNGLLLPKLEGGNSGPWNPALKAHRKEWAGVWTVLEATVCKKCNRIVNSRIDRQS